MQKKILLSLMLSVPFAQGALADITLESLKDATGWDISNVVGDDKTIDVNNNSVTVGIGAGQITRTVKDLPKGEYTITFTSTSNIKLTVNGAVVDPGAKFEAEGTITIAITAVNPDEVVMFSGATLTFAKDFSADAAALTESLNAVEYSALEEGAPGYDALMAQKEELDAKKAELAEKIAVIAGYDKPSTELLTVDELIKIYNEYNGANGFDALQDAIKTYAQEVEDWNAKVEAANDELNTIKDNTTTEAALLAGVDQLLENVDALIAAIEAEGVPAYAQDLDLNLAKSLRGEIKQYEEAIKAAYENKSEKVEFESQEAALQGKIDELTAKFQGDVADYNAFEALKVSFADFTKAYNEAQTVIPTYKGVAGYETVYADVQTEWLNQITAAYNEAEEQYNPYKEAPAAGLAEKKGEIEAAFAAAETEFQNILDSSKALVDDQNAAYGEAQETYGALKARYEEMTAVVIPDGQKTQQEEFAAKLAAAKEKLDALSAYIDEQYRAHTLSTVGGDFDTQVSALDQALAELEQFAADFAPLTDLLKALKKAQAYIAEQGETLDKDVIDLAAVMASVCNEIHTAIDEITIVNNVPDAAEVANVKEAIENLYATTDLLVNAFGTIAVNLKAFQVALGSYKTTIDAKIVVLNCLTEQQVLNLSKYPTMLANVETMLAELKAAAGATGNAVYDEAKAVNDKFEATYGAGDAWKAYLADVELTFAKTVTEKNKAAVAAKISAVKAAYAGIEDAPALAFTDLDVAFDAVSTKVAAATDAELYGECDVDLEKLAADIVPYDNSVQAYIALLPTLEGLQTGINQLEEENQASSIGNGQAYFTNLITGTDEGCLQGDYNTLKAALRKALTDVKLGADKAAFEARLEQFQLKIEQTAQDMLANNAAHTQQLAKSATVRTTLQSYIDHLNTLDADLVAEGLAAIKKLQEQDLLAEDQVVAEAYGTGKSHADNDAIMAEYDRILAEALDIYIHNSNGDYQAAVTAANTAFVAAQGWDDNLKALYRVYINSIGQYNQFILDTTNPNYHTILINAIHDHQSLYDYSTQIRNLQEGVAAWIADQNKNSVVITLEMFEAHALTPSADMKTAMEANVALMNEKAAAAAEGYYASAMSAAQQVVANAVALYNAQGISTEVQDENLKAANDKIAAALALYTDSKALYDDPETAATANHQLAVNMDQIANLLAQVTVSYQAAATAQWTLSYTAATEEIKTLNANLATYKAEGLDIEDVIEEFNAIVEEIEALNEDAKAQTNLIAHFKANYLDVLEGYMTDLRNLEAQAKAQYDNQVANNEIYHDFTGYISDFKTQLETLNAYIAAFTSAQSVSTSDIAAMIARMANIVNANKAGNLPAYKTTLDNLKAQIETTIEGRYVTAEYAEYRALQTWAYNLQIAFNNASERSSLPKEELDAYNVTIDGYLTAIQELALNLNFEKRAEFQQEALALMVNITNLYEKLQTSWTEANSTSAALAVLNGIYAEVEQVVVKGQNALANCEESVQQTYASQYESLQAQLEAIQAAYSAEGNLVLASQGKYEAELAALKAAVTNLNAEVAAADQVAKAEAQKKATNDKVYGELSTELAGWQTTLDALVAELENYGYAEQDWYLNQIERIQNALEGAKAYLEEENEGIQLTENSNLDSWNWVVNQMAYVTYVANYNYFDAQRTICWNALNGVKLTGDYLNYAELSNELNALWNSWYEAANPDWDEVEPTYEAYTAVYKASIEKFFELREAAQTLVEKAQENRYYPGDVTLDPNGEVNIVDIQTVAEWIGEGKTLADLSPKQAAAANVNGDNVLNVADLSAIIKIALGESASAVYAGQFRAPIVQGVDHFDVRYVGQTDGIDRFAIELNNTNAMTAGQFDIKLPAGMTLVRVVSADRVEGHEVEVYENSSSETRVVLYSLSNAPIQGNSGAVVYVDVAGDGSIAVDAMTFADENAVGYEVSKVGTSGIDSIRDGARSTKEAIYDAAGRLYNGVQRGLNIIRNSDGTVTKEYRK